MRRDEEDRKEDHPADPIAIENSQENRLGT